MMMVMMTVMMVVGFGLVSTAFPFTAILADIFCFNARMNNTVLAQLLANSPLYSGGVALCNDMKGCFVAEAIE